jgi:hypothetical protein
LFDFGIVSPHAAVLLHASGPKKAIVCAPRAFQKVQYICDPDRLRNVRDLQRYLHEHYKPWYW